MYRYTLIVVGKLKLQSLAGLCSEYAKRLNRQGSFEAIELKDGTIESEGVRILEALDKRRDAKVYVLAEEGIQYTSRSLALELSALQGRPAVFVIGGAFGLSDSVKTRADVNISLSSLTFTHEMARCLLSEQLYRSVSINSGSKYHHD